MKPIELEAMLERIGADEASPEQLARARAAIEGSGLWPGLPTDELFLDDPSADALALLSLVRPEAGVLAEAVREASGAAGVVDGVMAALFGERSLPVASAVVAEAGPPPEVRVDDAALPVAAAVRAEAGRPPELAAVLGLPRVDVASAVAHEAGRAPDVSRHFDEVALPLREAVGWAAGRVEIADSVIARLGLPDADLAGAVRDEAGPVDVLDAVLAQLGLDEGGVAEVVELPIRRPSEPDMWLSALLDRELAPADHVRVAAQVVDDADARLTLGAYADVGRELREGIAREAGAVPSVWHAVARAIGVEDPERVAGWDPTVLGEAVRREAGEAPSVVGAVVAALDRVPAEPELDAAPANVVGSWPTVLAAIAAVVIGVLLLPQLQGLFAPEQPFTERVAAMEMAVVGEVNVDELTYGENASVFVEVPTDADTPLIIWVDEGAL